LHGDIRCPEDVAEWPPFDLLVDCSAQPSVHAGLNGSPVSVMQNNLHGTINCAEAARRRNAPLLFLSTSRVYPIEPLNDLPFHEQASRFSWSEDAARPGFSRCGIAETFPLAGARSFYGATKLASELLLQEYAYSYRLPVLINRCGILTGPWQMGKVDQGVVTFWITSHLFQRQLRYTGFGGSGKQVRDILHVDDLFRLLVRQLQDPGRWNGSVYNVGGGNAISLSLAELTDLCRQATRTTVPIEPVPETAAVDLRIYVTDARRAMADFAWRPERDVADTVDDICRWAREHRDELATVL
jgi:CDP-paratose 2-epimerase